MIKPRNDWIFFEVIKVAKVGGIIIPDGSPKERDEVMVLAVGPKVKEIRVGQQIVISPKLYFNYYDPDKPEAAMRGFVSEEGVIAVVEDRVGEN